MLKIKNSINLLTSSAQSRANFIRAFILVVSGISPFIIPLLKICQTSIVRDWGYFNGLSLVVHSSVWHYHVFPIHNPWILGGTDILANPQSRVFSPFMLYDVLFTAPYANLFALITLAIVGSFGFYQLACYLKVSKNMAVLGSIFFLHTTWFTLHFSEGHITFGSFLLLALAFYFILRIQETNFKIYYALLNAFYLLDGAIYAFIFNNLLLIAAILFCTHQLRPLRFVKSLLVQWKTVLLSITIFLCLASAKLLPFLWLHQSRVPILEFISVPLKYLVHCLFNPFQDMQKLIPGINISIGFHEVGVYVGILATLLVVAYLIRVRKTQHIPYLLLLGFFFWVASGFLATTNPWLLFQKIPVVNNAHVQTRLFIISFLIFALLLTFALDYFRTRFRSLFFWPVVVFLVVESLFVSNYPFYRVYSFDSSTCPTATFGQMISSTTIQKTVTNASLDWGFEFQHYFNTNTGAKITLEPAATQGDIKTVADTDYRGEIYVSKGRGKVQLLSYTPGKICINYALDTLSEIELNTNYLLGWKTNNKNIKITQNRGLLTLTPSNLVGQAELVYQPAYLYFIFPLYFIGLALSIVILLRRK
ncbi:MAG: hypothetical protein WCQ95_06435 [Bacteroidota bacterium]